MHACVRALHTQHPTCARATAGIPVSVSMSVSVSLSGVYYTPISHTEHWSLYLGIEAGKQHGVLGYSLSVQQTVRLAKRQIRVERLLVTVPALAFADKRAFKHVGTQTHTTRTRKQAVIRLSLVISAAAHSMLTTGKEPFQNLAQTSSIALRNTNQKSTSKREYKKKMIHVQTFSYDH